MDIHKNFSFEKVISENTIQSLIEENIEIEIPGLLVLNFLKKRLVVEIILLPG